MPTNRDKPIPIDFGPVSGKQDNHPEQDSSAESRGTLCYAIATPWDPGRNRPKISDLIRGIAIRTLPGVKNKMEKTFKHN